MFGNMQKQIQIDRLAKRRLSLKAKLLERRLAVTIGCDVTGSMGQSITAIRKAIGIINSMLSLVGASALLGVLGDYDKYSKNSHQGGVAFALRDPESIAAFMEKYLHPVGGGGYPEAYKTFLNLLLKQNEETEEKGEKKTLILFADAIPHGVPQYVYTAPGGQKIFDSSLDEEGKIEESKLNKSGLVWDWQDLCTKVQKTGYTVIVILTNPTPYKISVWSKLGYVVPVKDNSHEFLAHVLMTTLYQLMGLGTPDPKVVYNYTTDGKDIKTLPQLPPIIKEDLGTLLGDVTPEKAFNAFSLLLDPNSPEQVMSLMTSPILGKVWQLICGRFQFMENKRHAGSVKTILGKFTKCLSALPEDLQKKLKTWVNLTRDRTSEISAIIQGAMPHSDTSLYFPGDIKYVSMEVMRDFGNGKPSEDLFRKIWEFLGSVTQGPTPKECGASPMFVPSELKDHQVFSLLGHLICPGYMFSQNVSLLVAILCLNNKTLGKRAANFLGGRKGSWIKWDVDEKQSPTHPFFWTPHFFRVLASCPTNFLTTGEIKFRDHYCLVRKILANLPSNVQVSHPKILSLCDGKTWSRLCGGCGHPRCFTIFPGDNDLCGLCIALGNPKIRKDGEARGFGTDPKKMQPVIQRWTTCFPCRGNYMVCNPGDLRECKPKCHYCRHGGYSPQVVCYLCQGKYLSPGKSAHKAMKMTLENSTDMKVQAMIRDALKVGGWVCPICVDNRAGLLCDSSVSIRDLIAENPCLRDLFPFPYDLLTKSSIKFVPRILSLWDAKDTHIPSVEDIKLNVSLRYNGLLIHNPRILMENMRKILFMGSGTSTCGVCFNDTPVRDMVPCCGNCNNSMCKSCHTSWYGQIALGGVVSHGNAHCPYCKSAPRYAGVKHLPIGGIRNARISSKNTLCDWRPDTIYAACKICLLLKPALPNTCGQAIPAIKDWSCDDCRESANARSLLGSAAPAAKTKNCPGCGIHVEKNGGCNHITCLNCDTHWCWVCQWVQEGHIDIYDHMDEKCGMYGSDNDSE